MTFKEFEKWVDFYFEDLSEYDKKKLIENVKKVVPEESVVIKEVPKIVKQYLSPNTEEFAEKPNLYDLAEEFCKKEGVELHHLQLNNPRSWYPQGKKRSKELSQHRRHFVLFCMVRFKYNITELASFVGWKDHSVVSRVVNGKYEEDIRISRMRARKKKYARNNKLQVKQGDSGMGKVGKVD